MVTAQTMAESAGFCAVEWRMNLWSVAQRQPVPLGNKLVEHRQPRLFLTQLVGHTSDVSARRCVLTRLLGIAPSSKGFAAYGLETFRISLALWRMPTSSISTRK